ncbi:MAG TPA: hypothetical protein VGD77_17315 [Gemmatimonadaceae bacterium]
MTVKKLMLALLVLAGACTTRTVASTPQPASAGGATSPRAAASAFLSAVRQQDLGALGLVWGTATGPARNTMPTTELEMRGTVMMRFLRHETAQVVDDSPATGGQRLLRVELTCGVNKGQTTLTAVPTAEGRWYILSADLESARDLCR